jgi:hypothetical protein
MSTDDARAHLRSAPAGKSTRVSKLLIRLRPPSSARTTREAPATTATLRRRLAGASSRDERILELLASRPR